MTSAKRTFDILVALLLAVLLSPLIVGIAAAILWREGRPVLYVAERMRAPGEAFGLAKFRTMTQVAADSGVSGGDKAARITPTGRWLRRTRADELPQLWNVLRGDMSFVGPRPPLRQYVERFPDLYTAVLRSRPGITGLATLYFHEHEERLLARSATPEETDAIYSRACVPRKARLDLIYQRNRSLCYDVALMWRTLTRRSRKR